ncbi:MAG: SH3 domain-containing protein [Mesorhizobium sp.]|nr:MAG: SH3 domain-containing protein [Mesorhizobium sp.]RWK66366.1 MAG: SH3 domain-containing protein [Mesorhizobium sp.]RWK73483.1 MAG: SH3 domain-containing protein [Mesorhizobium sp.]RWK77076.1 MAG: SH3 domain-containing protein [Mesorhizobium sp.]RWL02598.1 MAG: SH3 domain-containing protein [Mesorhizobium sp.]
MPTRCRFPGTGRKNVGPQMEVARVREPFSFGAPERRRFAMQFGYDMQPRFWRQIRSNLHLVIAAFGTAALLGVAAVALWLALPASERQAVASPEQIVSSIPVKTTRIVPTAAAAAAARIEAAQQAASKTDAISSAVFAAKAEIAALAPNDPRWTGSGPKTAAGQVAGQAEKADKPSTAAAFADPAAKTKVAALIAKVAAPAKAATDRAQTAAIPTPKPLPAAAQKDGAEAKVEAKQPSAAGRILRGVTMRTGPKNGAAAIVTIPAKTSVQVMGCKKWCEIVYNGKRGWIYKSFVKTGA